MLNVWSDDLCRHNFEEIFINSCYYFYWHSICCAVWSYFDYKLYVGNLYSVHFNAPGNCFEVSSSIIFPGHLTVLSVSVLFSTCKSQRGDSAWKHRNDWSPKSQVQNSVWYFMPLAFGCCMHYYMLYCRILFSWCLLSLVRALSLSYLFLSSV